jgi:hypothetical protein
MTTPEEARAIAAKLRNVLFWSDEAFEAAEALESLARQLEEMWKPKA